MANQVKKISKVLRLHDVNTYNVENMCFTEPQLFTISDKVTFYRVGIYTKNQKPDGSLEGNHGDLILKFPTMFSFGISENMSMNDPTVVAGYSVPLCVWDKEGKTEEQDKATKLLEQIVDKCKDYLVSIRGKIRRFQLEKRDLKDMDKLLYWQMDAETGERVEGVGPIFSPKLIEYKGKNGKPATIGTIFYDKDGNETDFRDFISRDKQNRKFCNVTPAIKVDNIFVGAKTINLQCKVYEADIVLQESGSRRLLHPNSKPGSSMIVSFSNDGDDVDDSDVQDSKMSDLNNFELN